MKPRERSAEHRLGAFLFLVSLFATGCHSLPPLPPADLLAPGWRVQQGQAVWKPSRDRPALAGEILLATQANKNFFVQFTKTPFPLATARCVDGQWQIEFGAGGRRFAGRGAPPPRFVWFQLPPVLRGQPIDDGWQFTRLEKDSWRLENSHTGESLEGMFFPSP